MDKLGGNFQISGSLPVQLATATGTAAKAVFTDASLACKNLRNSIAPSAPADNKRIGAENGLLKSVWGGAAQVLPNMIMPVVALRILHVGMKALLSESAGPAAKPLRKQSQEEEQSIVDYNSWKPSESSEGSLEETSVSSHQSNSGEISDTAVQSSRAPSKTPLQRQEKLDQEIGELEAYMSDVREKNGGDSDKEVSNKEEARIVVKELGKLMVEMASTRREGPTADQINSYESSFDMIKERAQPLLDDLGWKFK
jgi:hypothetical protein